MEQFTLKGTQKLAEQLLQVGQMRKYAHQNRQERLFFPHSWHQLHPQHSALQSGEKSQLLASPCKPKGLDSISSTPTAKTHQRDKLTKSLALKTNGACIHKTYNSIAKKETILNKHVSTHQGYHSSNQHRGNRQNCTPHSFPLKEYLHTLKAAA